MKFDSIEEFEEYLDQSIVQKLPEIVAELQKKAEREFKKVIVAAAREAGRWAPPDIIKDSKEVTLNRWSEYIEDELEEARKKLSINDTESDEIDTLCDKLFSPDEEEQ